MELLQSFWNVYSGSNVGAQKNQQNSPFCDGNRFSWGIVWSLVFTKSVPVSANLVQANEQIL